MDTAPPPGTDKSGGTDVQVPSFPVVDAQGQVIPGKVLSITPARSGVQVSAPMDVAQSAQSDASSVPTSVAQQATPQAHQAPAAKAGAGGVTGPNAGAPGGQGNPLEQGSRECPSTIYAWRGGTRWNDISKLDWNKPFARQAYSDEFVACLDEDPYTARFTGAEFPLYGDGRSWHGDQRPGHPCVSWTSHGATNLSRGSRGGVVCQCSLSLH